MSCQQYTGFLLKGASECHMHFNDFLLRRLCTGADMYSTDRVAHSSSFPYFALIVHTDDFTTWNRNRSLHKLVLLFSKCSLS